MTSPADTIAAIATAPGEGGVAIVRISGPQARRILSGAFRPARQGAEMTSHRLRCGTVVDAEGEAIDEAMAVFMRAPNTYTREDVAEIQCHGGEACSRAVLRRVLQLGARLAEPGEFTRRAFLSGRIDLSRAEAVMQLVGAQGEAARRAALRQMRGGVSFFVMDVVRRIEGLLAQIQAAVDFPDEIDEAPVAAQVRAEVGDIAAEVARRIDPVGARILVNGASVVLAGRPNVGKSSLMNAILNCERAIVTDIPGTTRDVLSERFELDGRVVRLSDTAGIRQSEDAIEQIGVERARGEMEGADVVLLVFDASQALTDADREMLAQADERCILCLNKSDLGVVLHESDFPGCEVVRLSAVTREGMDALLEALRLRLHARVEEDSFTAERHIRIAREALELLENCMRAIDQGFGPDVTSLDLYRACELFNQITGRDASEEVISSIFANFCVGK